MHGSEAQKQIKSALIAILNASSAEHLHVAMDDSLFMDHVKREKRLPKHTSAQFNLLPTSEKFTTPNLSHKKFQSTAEDLNVDDFTLGSSSGRALLDTKSRRQHW